MVAGQSPQARHGHHARRLHHGGQAGRLGEHCDRSQICNRTRGRRDPAPPTVVQVRAGRQPKPVRPGAGHRVEHTRLKPVSVRKPADFDARRVAGAKTAAPRSQTGPTRPDAGGVSPRPRVRLPVLSPRLLPWETGGCPGIYMCRFVPRSDHAGVCVEALRGHRDGLGRARGTLRP